MTAVLPAAGSGVLAGLVTWAWLAVDPPWQ